MSYRLVIPSRERAKWLMSQTRMNTLHAVHGLKPEFMVRTDDSQLADYVIYVNKYGIKCKLYDGDGIFGAAQTYDMIIDESIKLGYTKLLILDDDLSFAIHNPILGAKPMFRLTTPYETAQMFDHIISLTCEQVPIMSFTPIMARSQPNVIAYCKPMMMAYAYHLPHFAKHPEHRFWVGKHIEARCDLNLSLKMLTQGYLTAFMATCFIPDNVNNPGGCSTYRDLECEKASVAFLKKEFGPFVRTHKKRGWLNDTEVIREAPVISWQKAFNREAFVRNFGERASVFATRQIKAYEQVYGKFVEEHRA